MPGEITSQRHAELAAEHERKSQWHKGLSGGASVETPNAGSQAGGFVGAIMDHKWIFIGAVAAIIGLFLLMRNSGNQPSSTANQSPDLSQGNYVPSNISTALDSINAQISGLSNQLNNQNNSTTGTSTGTGSTVSTPTDVTTGQGFLKATPTVISIISNPPPTPPTPEPQYVSVTPWPSTFGSLSGIANAEGLTLARIEQLNPNLYNQQPGSGWDLIYPGQRVRIS